MRTIILLSAGYDTVSGRPAPVAGEIGAIGMALALGGEVLGVHVGPAGPTMREYAGYGLERIVALGAGQAGVVEALAAYIRSGAAFDGAPVDLVLTGRRGSGGEDSGLFPYALAHALDWPIMRDIVAIQATQGVVEVEQALPRGVRRRAHVKGPCVLGVHEMAPFTPAFSFAAMRRGEVLTYGETADSPPADMAGADMQIRPYRARPRLIQAQASGTGGQVMIDPTPQAAAQAIRDHLVMLGVLQTGG
ncbi:electron transfer flavoprotein subunit beta [Komagataeibacter saccharivorans]|uniref:electron transfer flavoprotein subunit beta n=1 Tax=Komagataeibacter saccharivorans TaxID=265959 RepID=UPI0039EB3A23